MNHNADTPLVAIIDYGMGNLFSVKQACDHAGLRTRITSDNEEILKSDAVILPGVGAFGDAMEALNRLDLVGSIQDVIKSSKPFMGICLGMQLLFTESEEFGRHKGLDIIKGAVVRFGGGGGRGKKDKVPQVGWNRINKPLSAAHRGWGNSPLADLQEEEFVYFVHSYYCIPEDKEIVLSATNYAGIEYCSSMLWKNVFATQFHPEKSAAKGLKIYKRWSASVKEKSEELI